MRRGRPPLARLVGGLCATAATLGLLTSCGESASRKNARESLVEQITEAGDIPEELAQCVVDEFFATRSDEELAAFMESEDATPEELAEFGRLTRECADKASAETSTST